MSHPLKIFMAITIVIMLTSLPVLGADLTSYRWKNRLLLVFSPTESDPGFAAFDPNVSRELAAVKDRDLIVFRVFEKGPSRVDEHPLSIGRCPKSAPSFRGRAWSVHCNSNRKGRRCQNGARTPGGTTGDLRSDRQHADASAGNEGKG